ncbi:MAG TPA: tRNA (5-methylaminomethyl-2-thiouridine)(34)-methyltransferase MnmD [Bacteroidales bacterium]|nr:tRNA (5-methylaminomethyl-2-thiouridine)(34)-methyltransferase MnmD [Bacteroidales bacterium]HPZ02671.1 tRNA (5-methylaminomethyl-2-thiouridine)(34)-methyltransferase MnmD [Bacteroidales bacterium]HQB74429.1 tRNA (5-methylaminomethyl-2-thiouridine)(34)-methyltransferase MnmD [Bacteroidales bacterium]
MKRSILITEDGSTSLKVDDLDEGFHSHFGAIQESQHIFIGAGLNSITPNPDATLSILEIGFGTGLNCFLTIPQMISRGEKLYYEAIEKYPLSQEEYQALNYKQLIQFPDSDSIFQQITEVPYDQVAQITPYFQLYKRELDFRKAQWEKERFDLVYFDPFSPDKQPEMWSLPVVSEVYQAMKPNGVLVTYSTKGTVKRVFKEAGFKIEKIPGPPGKREILRALK